MEDQKLLEIIGTAIEREEEAYAFYMDLHGKIDDKSAQETLEWVAAEEQKHKAFLVDYRDNNYGAEALRMSEVVYYKIAEHQEEPEVAKDMAREDVFLLASHRELKSYNFYTELAGLHPDGETKTMLLKIANEELKHKEKMEYLYANTAFPQTAGG
jgi:rubrerythrin